MLHCELVRVKQIYVIQAIILTGVKKWLLSPLINMKERATTAVLRPYSFNV